MEEIKACPFCGNDKVKLLAKKGKHGWFIFIECPICMCRSKTFAAEDAGTNEEFWMENADIRELAIAVWNRRA